MGIKRTTWLMPALMICLVISAGSNNLFAAEEIKAPLLTGKTWINMSPDQKTAYIWGAGDVIDLEQEIMGIYPELKRESFAAKAAEGIGDVKINDIVANVDAFYEKNQDKLNLSVIRVIWDSMIKPNLKTGIAGKPLR